MDADAGETGPVTDPALRASSGHSPLPWRNENGWVLIGDSELVVCGVNRPADAALIVEAVNRMHADETALRTATGATMRAKIEQADRLHAAHVAAVEALRDLIEVATVDPRHTGILGKAEYAVSLVDAAQQGAH